nr:hypothetical protein [uncultured Lachnoclostridium sp.]
MNEATFEARVNEEIKRIFPMINKGDITHQQQFQLTLGHNTYLYNGVKKDKAFARLDVLIKHKGVNLAILELKAPGIALSHDDAIQGTSYARLLDPMPPLTIVSNGEDTQFFTTYDRKQWMVDNVNEHIVQSLFQAATKCASADLDEAITILLGRDNDMWREILARYTKKAIKEMEGDIDDFTYQVARNFQLERTVVSQLVDKAKEYPLVSFVGPILAGKTNAIYQMCKKCPDDLIPVYIDANVSYDPLEKISNWFCKEVFRSLGANEVKQWLINGYSERKKKSRIVFIFDNICSVDDKLFWREINQLNDINRENSYSLLLVMNEHTYDCISRINSGPAKNAIGKAPMVKLDALSDEEFYNAMDFFMYNNGAAFYQGAQCNVQYRNPRILRVLASSLPKNNDSIDDNSDTKKVFFLPSYMNYSVLESVWSKIVTNAETRSDYRIFAEAMFNDMNSRTADPRLAILSATRGVISLKVAEQFMGTDRINRMKSDGHIHQLVFDDGKAYLYPRFPEAIATAAGYVLRDKIIEIIDRSNVENAYDFIMKNIDCIPYSDVAATKAVLDVCIEREVLWKLLCLLIKDSPLVKQNNDYGVFGLYFSDIGHIKLSGEIEGTLISNFNPWLLLSNLSTVPMAMENGSRDIQLEIFKVIGSFNNILIKPEDMPFHNMAGFHTHKYKDGEFICGKTGIVEPITYAMQCSFANMPEKMLQLSKEAIENDEFFLVMRLNVAARSMCTITDPLISQCAIKAHEMLKQYIYDSIKRKCTID